MTDKEQIIIDDVDVSKCTLYYYGRCNIACNPLNCLFCSEKPNCHYKQIARKTQVIDEIEEVIKPYQEQIELDALSLPSAIESILERKTQECEELKKENQELRNSLSDSLMFRFTSQDKEVDRYRKTLEEIDKVINNILNSCLGRNTVVCRPAHNVCGDLIKILDIINKAKGHHK